MKKNTKRRRKILETKYFGFLIGLFLFGFILLLNENTSIFSNIEEQMLDVHFGFKTVTGRESIQEGVRGRVLESKRCDADADRQSFYDSHGAEMESRS